MAPYDVPGFDVPGFDVPGFDVPGFDVPGFDVPGYDVGSALGDSSAWRARRRADGRTVLLRMVAPLPDQAEMDGLRRRVARVGGMAADSLLPVQTVVTTADALVVVYDFPAGGSLSALLAARHRLTVGEIVSLGTGLAAALATIHRAGLSHGSLAESGVWLGLDGTPLLADVGLVAGEPAGDVKALAGICRQALGQRRLAFGPAAALAAVINAAEKGAEADAHGFATALRRVAPGVPIRLGGTALSSEEPDERPARATEEDSAQAAAEVARSAAGRRRIAGKPGTCRAPGRVTRTGILIAAGGVLTLLAAVGLGIQWAKLNAGTAVAPLPPRPAPAAPTPGAPRSAPPTTAATAPSQPASGPATPTPAAISWRNVLDTLDRRRAAAFAAADPAALAAADAPSSAVLRADRQTAEDLRRRGVRPRGLRWEILSVVVDSAGPPGVVLRVTDRMPGYTLVDPAGAVRASRPARAPTVWRVTLLSATGGWRLADVVAG